MLRATKHTRFNEMIAAIHSANNESLEKCKLSINNNTEAYLVHKLAEHFYHTFNNLTYRFEVSPIRILKQVGLTDAALNTLTSQREHLRLKGAVDCCLYDIKTLKPAHLIEFKRGKGKKEIKKDILRLAGIIREVRKYNNKRGKLPRCKLETAYFVTTSKFAKSTPYQEVEEIFHSKLAHGHSDITRRRMNIDITYQIIELESNLNIDGHCDDKSVWGLVAELTSAK